MLLFIRFLNFICLTSGQKFTLDGDAGTITFVDDTSYTLYNERDLNLVDSSGTLAMRLTQSDTCTMEVDRRMVVHGELLASTSKSFKIQEFEQWKLVVIEDFQGSISGWSEDDIGNCGNSPDLFLGGHCKFSDTVLTKTFTLPAHSYVKLQLSFHFFDRWESESAYLKVDGNYVWSESYLACNNLHSDLCMYKGIDTCGDDFPDRMGYPVRYVGAHTHSSMEVEVSTTLDRDACEVSWAIDDIQIFIK